MAVTRVGKRAFRLPNSNRAVEMRRLTLMTSFDEREMPEDGAQDEQVSAFFRRFLPDFYFVNTPLSRMRRHLQLLRALPEQPLQIEFHCPAGAHFTELMLCGTDQAQPGLLAQVAGALSTLNINVHTAWIHTLSDPHSRDESPSEVVLNTLILSEKHFRRTRPLTQRSCEAVEAALRKIIEAEAPVMAFPFVPLQLDELSVTPAGRYTLIKVSAPNDGGALHSVAQAIARLNLDIAHAQINTFENSVADTFFVTDADGKPLEIAADCDIANQLRTLVSG